MSVPVIFGSPLVYGLEALANMIINLQVPQRAENFLST
jgi:hypothetical protein